MKLTKALRDAGIVEIGLRNTNGSYNCRLKLDKIDLNDSTTNYRGYDEQHAANIGKKFHLPSVRNPLLVYINKHLASLDGRHTVNVLRSRKGFNTITADVFTDLAQQDMATVFFNLTMSGKRMNPWAGFNAALEAKFDWAITINDALDKFEFTTPLNKVGPKAYADVKSIEPFCEAFKENPTLVAALAELVFVFAEDGKVVNTARLSVFIRGLLDMLIANIGHYTVEELAKLLSAYKADDYLKRANIEAKNCARTERGHYRVAFERLALPHKMRKAA